MDNEILLSICIPTYKREAILVQLVNSILMQNVDTSLYEICITDNSETDETKLVVEKNFSDVKNLVYKKVTCKGFMNSVEALKLGQGKFLKLHNDYSILNPGALQQMIETLRMAEKEHAQPFFTFGALKAQQGIMTFDDYDSFMSHITIQATWSSAFCMWKESFDSILASGMVPDEMFPHTSFLHRVTDYSEYIVDNASYVTNVEPKKKGGYNLIDNFVRIYLTMVQEDLLRAQKISQKTYDKIEDDILHFCANWYYNVKLRPEKFTYRFDDDESIVLQTCADAGLRKYKQYKRRRRPVYGVLCCKELIKKLFSENQE